MRIEIYIDGIDRSNECLRQGLTVETASDGAVSRASIPLRVDGALGSAYGYSTYGSAHYGAGGGPDVALKEVIIQEAGTSPVNVIFAGEVVQAHKKSLSKNLDVWMLECTGFESILDSTIVSETWTNKSDRYIIQEAFAAEAPEITVDDATIDIIESNLYLEAVNWTLRELLDRLATICGARWFLSHNRALYYSLETSSTPPAAPFGINVEYPDNTTTFSTNVTRGAVDYRSIANYVVVEGGYASGGSRVTYTAQDATSQTTYGVRKRAIVEEGLTTTALCQARAEAEILQFKDPQIYGSFVIRRDGLAVGQKIHIEAGAQEIDGDFLIKRIQMTWENPTDTVYTVEYGFYDARLDTLLAKLARANRRDKKGTILALPPEDSVDTLHIKDVAITRAKIELLAVGTGQMDNLSVTNAKLANLSVDDAKVSNLAVSKLTAGSATFASVTQFGYGGNKLTLESGYLRIESASTRYVNIGTQIDIANGGYQVSVTGSQVALTTDSLSGSSAVLTATGLTLKGTSAGAQAVLTAASLTFTAGTANTVVSAAGVQIYGGSTGVGIGNAVYASSPVRVGTTQTSISYSTGSLSVTASACQLACGSSALTVQTSFADLASPQVRLSSADLRVNGMTTFTGTQTVKDGSGSNITLTFEQGLLHSIA